MSVLQTKMDKLPVKLEFLHVNDSSKDIWRGFIIVNEQEKTLHQGTLTEMREWAIIQGFEGILL